MPNNRPLGRVQKQVLLVMLQDGGNLSVRGITYHMPSLEESGVRGAIRSLEMRSLVDVAGWDNRNARTYKLTDEGHRLAEQIWDGEEDPEL